MHYFFFCVWLLFGKLPNFFFLYLYSVSLISPSFLSLCLCVSFKSSHFNTKKSINKKMNSRIGHKKKRKRSAITNHHWTVNEVPLPQNNWPMNRFFSLSSPEFYRNSLFYWSDHILFFFSIIIYDRTKNVFNTTIN